MKERKMNYEAPEVLVFGVETQNTFASGNTFSTQSISDFEEEEGTWY